MPTNARYFRWTITRIRGGAPTITVNASLFQLSLAQNDVAWPSTTVVTNPNGSDPQSARNLVDGNLLTRWFDSNFNNSDFNQVAGQSVILIDASRELTFDGYVWGKPNIDQPQSDPTQWTLDVSNTGLDGPWTRVDVKNEIVSDIGGTRTRIYPIAVASTTTTTGAPNIDDVITTAPGNTTTSAPVTTPVILADVVEFSAVRFSKNYRKASGTQIPTDIIRVRNLSSEVDVTISMQNIPAIRFTPNSFTLPPNGTREITVSYSISAIDQLPAGLTTVGIGARITANTIVNPPPQPTLPPPTTAAPAGCPNAGEVIQTLPVVLPLIVNGQVVGTRLEYQEFYLAPNPDPRVGGCITLVRVRQGPTTSTPTTTTQAPVTTTTRRPAFVYPWRVGGSSQLACQQPFSANTTVYMGVQLSSDNAIGQTVYADIGLTSPVTGFNYYSNGVTVYTVSNGIIIAQQICAVTSIPTTQAPTTQPPVTIRPPSTGGGTPVGGDADEGDADSEIVSDDPFNIF